MPLASRFGWMPCLHQRYLAIGRRFPGSLALLLLVDFGQVLRAELATFFSGTHKESEMLNAYSNLSWSNHCHRIVPVMMLVCAIRGSHLLS
jgi:hypothetical protein